MSAQRTPLAERLAALIAQTGPMSVATYMATCLHDSRHGYYAQRPGIGRDFITAPEISQVYGELIGLWCVKTWLDFGSPPVFRLIELGGGRGALLADALRASRVVPEFRAALRVSLVEASQELARLQGEAAARAGVTAAFHDRLEDAPRDPCVIIANEFLDCMPVRQFVRVEDGWRERMVGVDPLGELAFGLGPTLPALPAYGPDVLAEPGQVIEIAPGLEAFVDALADRLKAAPGRALFVDYGPAASALGDTLQAIRNGEKIGPLAAPGESDLTAHVDFAALLRFARARGLDGAGPTPQGLFLNRLGGQTRVGALAHMRPQQAAGLQAGYRRLTSPDAMGELFKAVCLSSPGSPYPDGFEPGDTSR